MPDTPVTFKVFRCAPGGEASRFDTFEVAVPGHASVLDALDAIRVDIAPTLVYRHSCHHSSCGTCAMRINGRDRLACITPAHEAAAESSVQGTVTLEPLRGLPLQGDLMVDMRAFYRHFDEHWSTLRPSEGRAQAALPAGIERFTRLENCIECGCCVSACPVTGTETGDGTAFAGPAVLAAVRREMGRGPDVPEGLAALAFGPHGEQHCQRHLACSRACPNGVYPARAIMDLRRMRERKE